MAIDDHRDPGDETAYDLFHDVTRRGRWCRIAYRRGGAGRVRFHHYYRGVKVPWLAWAMFS